MHFENTITIRRPVGEVFGFVADFKNIPTWNYAIVQTEQSPGPTRVGTTILQRRSIPNPGEETLEVTDFVPERRIELRGALGPFDGTMRYDFEPTKDGTRLRNVADLQGRGLLGIAAPIATGRVREAVAANLNVLKQILESRAE